MDEPIALGPGEGIPVKADRPELSLLEVTFEPEAGIQPHFHRRHSDSFYVLEGELEFHVGDEVFTATGVRPRPWLHQAFWVNQQPCSRSR